MLVAKESSKEAKVSFEYLPVNRPYKMMRYEECEEQWGWIINVMFGEGKS